MNGTQRTVVLGVAAAVIVAALAVIVVVLSGGGSGGGKSNTAAPPTATSAVTTTTTTITTVPSTSTPTTGPAPTPSIAVGLVVTGSGNTFSPPAAPTVVPYTPDCRTLVDPGFYGQCLTVAAPSGTVAVIVEQLQQNYQRGQPIVAGQERDLVYRRQGANYQLVLRRIPEANGSAETRLYQSDVNRDGDPKAVFITPAPNSQYGNELDVVEGTGVVTLYRQLHGGFAGIASGGGLDTFIPDPGQGYDEAVIRFRTGGWQIVSDRRVSDAYARAQNAQPFYDPQGATSG